MIVEEMTANGVVEPGRLYEPPYTDDAPTGVDHVFPTDDVDVIVEILHQVRDHARPGGAA